MHKAIKIVDHPKQWFLEFNQGWLDYFVQTGVADWSRYNYLINEFPPTGKGIAKENLRLLLISVAGAYEKDRQVPFGLSHLLEDVSIRHIHHPINSQSLSFSGSKFRFIDNRQLSKIFFPINLLEQINEEGCYSKLIPTSISINGEIPNILRIEKELLPTIIRSIRDMKANAVLLLPSSDLSIQTAMLLARGLELYNIPAVLVTHNKNHYERILPPRIVFENIPNQLKHIQQFDQDEYKKVLKQAIACLSMEAPVLVDKI